MLSLYYFTFALGAQKKRLIDTVLLNTQNICFGCDYDILHISSGFMIFFLHLFNVLKRSVFLSIRVF